MPFRLLPTLAVVLLCGCSSVEVLDYSDNQPKLDPQTFFDGELNAHGVVKDRGGLVIRYFNATIDASWENGIGTLHEEFLFDDGEEQIRIWTLAPNDEGGYDATAGDVVGVGDAQVAGNSMFLEYVLRVPYNDGTIDLAIDDRMYLINDKVLVNESIMSKFGFEVGSILLTIIKN